jgi:hypothetical protein
MVSDGLRRRGRPPLSGEAKRGSFHTRLRESLKNQLDAAAEAAGRSLSEEIEYRLERSFRDDRESIELIRNEQFEGMLLLLIPAMAYAGDRTRFNALDRPQLLAEPLPSTDDWMLDPSAFDQAVQAANTIFQALRPDGDPAPVRKRDSDLGIRTARGFLARVTYSDFRKAVNDLGKRARQKLGVIADLKLPKSPTPPKAVELSSLGGKE